MSEVMQRARGIFKGAGFSSLDDAVFSFAMLLAKAKLSEFEEEGVISNVNTAISMNLKEMISSILKYRGFIKNYEVKRLWTLVKTLEKRT